MSVAPFRQVRWIPRVLARWLAGALIAVGILYVWLVFELTHHRCGNAASRTPTRLRVSPGPCGYHDARFSALLGISAAAVLMSVGIWFAVNGRQRKRQGA